MPRGDGTGPQGDGPRTGWGMGNCPPNTQGQPTPAQTPTPLLGRGRGGIGRGLGRRPGGRGGGRGRRNGRN